MLNIFQASTPRIFLNFEILSIRKFFLDLCRFWKQCLIILYDSANNSGSLVRWHHASFENLKCIASFPITFHLISYYGSLATCLTSAFTTCILYTKVKSSSHRFLLTLETHARLWLSSIRGPNILVLAASFPTRRSFEELAPASE